VGLRYTTGEASASEIYLHLMGCNESFISSLDKRVSLRRYSSRLSREAITFEAWDIDILVGLVAAYFNEPDGQLGYITNVSTAEAYEGQGIASALIVLCIGYAVQYGFKTIGLEVKRANTRAIDLYKRFQFHERESKSASMMQMELDIL